MEYKEEVVSFNTIAICKKNIHRMYLTRNSNFEPIITFYLKDEDKCNNLSHEIRFKNDFVAEEIFREVIKRAFSRNNFQLSKLKHESDHLT